MPLTRCFLVLLLFCGCSSAPRQPGETSWSAPGKQPSEASVRVSDIERCVDLYRQSWDALEAGRGQEAARLLREAVRNLDPDSPDNVNAGRIKLLRELAVYAYFDARMTPFGRELWSRKVRAEDMLEQRTPSSKRGSSSGRSVAPTREEIKRPEDATEYIIPSTSTVADDTQHEVAADGSDPRLATGFDGSEGPSPVVAPPVPAELDQEQRARHKVRMLRVEVLLALGIAAHVDDAISMLEEDLSNFESAGQGGIPEERETRELWRRATAQRNGVEAPSTGGGRFGRNGRGEGDPSAGGRVAQDPNGLDDLMEQVRESFEGSSDTAQQMQLAEIEAWTGNPNLADAVLLSLLGRFPAGSDGDLWARARRAELNAADGGGRGGIDDLAALRAELRRRFGAGHPFSIAASRRLAEAVAQGGDADAHIDLLEADLRELVAELGDQHSVVQEARGRLVGAYIDQGRTADALAQLRAGLLAGKGSPSRGILAGVSEIDLAEQLVLGGDVQAAGGILRGIVPAGFSREREQSSTDRFQQLREDAERLMRNCRLEEALEVLNLLVEEAASGSTVSGQVRAEDLRQLGALLRVLGRSRDARIVELEARLLDGFDPVEVDHLADLARTEVDSPLNGPGIVVRASTIDEGGRVRVTAEIEDPNGIGELQLFQDGLPIPFPLGGSSWKTDDTGTRAVFEFDAHIPDGAAMTLISLQAKDLLGSVGTPVRLAISRS